MLLWVLLVMVPCCPMVVSLFMCWWIGRLRQHVKQDG
jgi:hypothetical protein